MYEAGLRVPMIVRWPGVSKPHRSDDLVSTVDLLPTILDAAGLDPPAVTHGMSLRPRLAGEDGPWREYLVAEFHFHGYGHFIPRRAIRDHRFKLIHNLLPGETRPRTIIDGDTAFDAVMGPAFDGTAVQEAFRTYADPPEWELYDLEDDPVEFVNLAGDPSYRETLERLKTAAHDYAVRTDDPFLDPAYLEKIRPKK